MEALENAVGGGKAWKPVFYSMTSSPREFAALMGNGGPEWVERQVDADYERVKKGLGPGMGSAMLVMRLFESVREAFDEAASRSKGDNETGKIEVDPHVHMIPRVASITLLGGHWTGYAYDRALDAVTMLLEPGDLAYKGDCAIELMLDTPVNSVSETASIRIPASFSARSAKFGPSSIQLTGLGFD